MDGLMSKVPPIKGAVKSIKVKFAGGGKLKRKFGGDHDADDKMSKKSAKGKLYK